MYKLLIYSMLDMFIDENITFRVNDVSLLSGKAALLMFLGYLSNDKLYQSKTNLKEVSRQLAKNIFWEIKRITNDKIV